VGERFGNHRNAIDAARDAGVSLIVYTSILNASTARMQLADEHRDTEEYLRDSGLPFVILRNGGIWRITPTRLRRSVSTMRWRVARRTVW
jgi:uncharacterized protein YbjT (DUF2867 family)